MVLELAQCLALDLADALPRYPEVLAHLFERVLMAVEQPMTQLKHGGLALVKLLKRLTDPFAQQHLTRLLDGRHDIFIRYEVAVRSVTLVADWGLERYRLSGEV